MLEVEQVRSCCYMLTVEAVRKEQTQPAEQGTFEDERHSAGHLDCTDWILEVEGWQQLTKQAISSYLLVEH